MTSVGIDLVEINAFVKAVNQTGELKSRLFSPDELKERERIGDENLAVWFAAKEAVMKAIWSHVEIKIDWHDIVIMHGVTGQPVAIVKDPLVDRLGKKKIKDISLSVSHVPPLAAAVALVQFS